MKGLLREYCCIIAAVTSPSNTPQGKSHLIKINVKYTFILLRHLGYRGEEGEQARYEEQYLIV